MYVLSELWGGRRQGASAGGVKDTGKDMQWYIWVDTDVDVYI